MFTTNNTENVPRIHFLCLPTCAVFTGGQTLRAKPYWRFHRNYKASNSKQMCRHVTIYSRQMRFPFFKQCACPIFPSSFIHDIWARATSKNTANPVEMFLVLNNIFRDNRKSLFRVCSALDGQLPSKNPNM